MKELEMTDIDALQKKVADLLADLGTEIDKARHRKVTVEHYDDGDPDAEYEDVSNPAMSANDDTNGTDENDDTTLDDEDDEEPEEELTKATINAAVMRNDPANRPGARKESTHSQSKHKFEALVSKIVNEHGIPASQAQAYVRVQYPDLYHSFQQFTPASTAKRAPDLVEAEMAKGCTREVAAQRVAQLHGFPGFANPTRIEKRRADLVWEFQKRVDEVKRDDRVDAAEATRRVRLEDPPLFAAMQRAG
jgi:hypothetical protein